MGRSNMSKADASFQSNWSETDSGIERDPEAGVRLGALPEGSVLEVRTRGHCYVILIKAGDDVLISGHPTLCPVPVRVRIQGSTRGGSMLKVGFIEPGMQLVFQHPTYRTVTTSRIVGIRRTS